MQQPGRTLYYLRSSYPDDREMPHIPAEAFLKGRGVFLRNGGLWKEEDLSDIEGIDKDANGAFFVTKDRVSLVVAHRPQILSAYRRYYRMADEEVETVTFDALDKQRRAAKANGTEAVESEQSEPEAEDHAPRTVRELRAWLKAQGVAFDATARKPELERLYATALYEQAVRE